MGLGVLELFPVGGEGGLVLLGAFAGLCVELGDSCGVGSLGPVRSFDPGA